MSREAVQDQWRERLAKFEASGQTQRQWCQENNVPMHRFKYWRGRLSSGSTSTRETPGATWCAVQLQADTVPAGLMVHAGGASIEVMPGFNASLLRCVVQALRGGGDVSC